jgi:hypothetical protein
MGVLGDVHRIDSWDWKMDTQLNLRFTARQKRALDKMAKELGSDPAGVLTRALSLFQLSLEEQEKGNNVAIVKDGKKVEKIVEITR